MHRIKMTMVTRVTRAQLPKPLAVVHRCSGADDTMYSTNERFDLGRLVMLGCPSAENPAAEQVKARNASAVSSARSRLSSMSRATATAMIRGG